MPCRVLEDEIEQLRHQLRETADENGRLYKLLKERDFEIKHLKKKIDEDRFAFTGSAAIVRAATPPRPEAPGCAEGQALQPRGLPGTASSGFRCPRESAKGSGAVKLSRQVLGMRERMERKTRPRTPARQEVEARNGRRAFWAVLATPLGLITPRRSLRVHWASRIHLTVVLWLTGVLRT